MSNKNYGAGLLAEGYGVSDMLDVCYKNNWSNDNTILVVDNPGNLDSHWAIYDID